MAGNRLAGRGNRTAGTVTGVAVGAAAGALIDKAEDSGRDRDACAAYLDDDYARMVPPPGYPAPAYPGAYASAAYPPNGYGPGYGYGYGYGYPAAGCCAAPAMMMVPVVQAAPHCTETVEYVYEDVPAPARRVAPRRSRVPDKRVKLAPNKRVPTR
ncbi:hypothetical protein [Novosphingobium soli]|uniref:hypothetical protein n=1 Tax=Novosphingobium soli TaxID=574956 RepID=UPI0036303B94